MENSIFIKMLEFGESCGINGADFNDLRGWLTENNYIKINDSEKRDKLMVLYKECFGENCNLKNTLKTEYFYRLVEHREFQLAISASRSANTNSFIAIGISIFAIICSVIAAYIQITSSISLDKNQLESIIQANQPPHSQVIVIEESQLKKISSTIENRDISISKEQFNILIEKIDALSNKNPENSP